MIETNELEKKPVYSGLSQPSCLPPEHVHPTPYLTNIKQCTAVLIEDHINKIIFVSVGFTVATIPKRFNEKGKLQCVLALLNRSSFCKVGC